MNGKIVFVDVGEVFDVQLARWWKRNELSNISNLEIKIHSFQLPYRGVKFRDKLWFLLKTQLSRFDIAQAIMLIISRRRKIIVRLFPIKSFVHSQFISQAITDKIQGRK